MLIFVNLSIFLCILFFNFSNYLIFLNFKTLFLFNLKYFIRRLLFQLVFLHLFKLLFITFLKHLNFIHFFFQLFFFDKCFIFFHLLVLLDIFLWFFSFHNHLLNNFHMLRIQIVIQLFFFQFRQHKFIHIIIVFTSFFLNTRISFLLPGLGLILLMLNLIH